MDDIVIRLRTDFECYDHAKEAADEIERLRALLAHGLTNAYDCKGCDLCEQLKAIHQKAVQNGF